MSATDLPKLRLHHGSSALAISQLPVVTTHTSLSYPKPITIHAEPNTDLWRKPPSTDVDTAPIIMISAPFDLHHFRSARVTVSADWNTLYDQGGLAIFIPDEDTNKWVKAGIEFVFGKPHVGTVAASRWADWSLAPLSPSAKGKVTIEFEREVDDDGSLQSSLWVNVIDPETGEKSGVRQITWWFRHDLDKTKSGENQVLLVGLYAARPRVPTGEGKEKEELKVNFEDFEVKLFNESEIAKGTHKA